MFLIITGYIHSQTVNANKKHWMAIVEKPVLGGKQGISEHKTIATRISRKFHEN